MFFNNKVNDIDNEDFKPKNHKYKLLIPVFIIMVLILIVVFLFINKSNKEPNEIITYFLNLEGTTEITLYKDSTYIEPGYNAYDSNNIDVTNKVSVINNIDTSTIGDYTITYSIDTISKTRTIHIIEKPTGATYIHLKGDDIIYLNIGEKYNEPGCVVIDTVDSNLTSKVIIKNNIDSSKAGIYEVTYTVTNSSNVTTTATRKVIVMDSEVSLTLDNENYTNQDININIHINDNYFSYFLTPKNEKITTKDYSYKVSSNGTYKFTIYNTKGTSSTKEITVTNIDKEAPTGSCTGYIQNGKSYITVNATDNVGISKYISNDVNTTSNVITLNNEVSTPTVTIYDVSGNTRDISCTLEKTQSKQLEIHFIASGHYDDAILIRTDDKVIFIDGGRDNCKKKIIPYLQELGVTKIDMMIGSHLDGDHIQAQAAILDNFTVSSIYYPDDIFTCSSTCPEDSKEYIVAALKKYNKTPIIQKPGTTITLGEMTLYFLAPYKLKEGSENDNSYIFILKYYNNTFMFTGDADGELEDTKIREYATSLGIDFKVDVLKYPHHGNATLNTSFWQAASPTYTIVPNYNASQFPNETNKNTIKKYSKMYRQSESKTGNIVIISDGNNIDIKTNTTASEYKR